MGKRYVRVPASQRRPLRGLLSPHVRLRRPVPRHARTRVARNGSGAEPQAWRGPVMRKDTLYVGLDTDKKHIDVAVAEPLPGGEVRYWGKIANAAPSVDRLIRKLGQDGRPLVRCYEAGPVGDGLHLPPLGKPAVTRAVVAASMIQRRSSVRLK